MTSDLPRGIRDNNPGNLHHSADEWQGQASEQTDPDYIVFTSSIWGIRALARTLLTYYRVHGLNTVRGIVNRWAPPSAGNDTPSYVADVAKRAGIAVTDNPIKVDDPGLLARLCAAIIAHENGNFAYPLSEISEAVTEALESETKHGP